LPSPVDETHFDLPLMARLAQLVPTDPVLAPEALNVLQFGDGTSDRRVDCAAAPGSFSVGQRVTLSAARFGSPRGILPYREYIFDNVAEYIRESEVTPGVAIR
jgi:hypothetical protein